MGITKYQLMKKDSVATRRWWGTLGGSRERVRPGMGELERTHGCACSVSLELPRVADHRTFWRVPRSMRVFERT